ncbi:MAG: hypothetical protein ACD_73C00279G0003 [uncultured bacterium]|nr:MAG: hypothetical protein ACD_73C00279G0003 [uncultured bacterium]
MNAKRLLLITINIALMVSVLIYVGISYFIGMQNGWTSSMQIKEGGQMLVFIFPLLSLSLIAVSFIIPNFLKPKDLGVESAEIKSFIFLNYDEVTPWIQKATIMRLALVESVAVLGLVLSLINQDIAWICPYALVSLCLQYVLGPLKR